jgi:hypothetical protein
MVDKLAYWAKLDTYWGEFDAADAEALLNLPHRQRRWNGTATSSGNARRPPIRA